MELATWDRSRALISLGAYITVVNAAGAAVAAAVIALGGWTIGPDPIVFGILLVLLLAGESRPVTWLFHSGSNHVTPTWAFISGLVFLTTGWIAAPLTMVASALGDMIAGKRPSRVAFNSAMLCLSVASGIGVLQVFGQRDVLTGGAPITWTWATVSLMAMAAMYLTNTMLLSLVIGLHEGVDVQTVLRRDALTNLTNDGMLLTLGPAFVIVGTMSPLLVAPLLLVCFLIFRGGEIAARSRHDATHDALTSLNNRRMFFESLGSALGRRSPRSVGTFAVMIIDLDDFKQINDTLGHDVGDAVLIEVADRLAAQAGPGVLVARLGGDEFALLVEQASGVAEVTSIGHRLLQEITRPLVSNGFPLTVGGSVGIAVVEPGEDPPSASKLMRRADVAMYSAKASRSGVMTFGEDISDDSAPGRVALVAQLERAIAAGQLHVHYQPITDTRSGMTTRLEALVRWRHPTLGEVMPGDFVPMAEQTDLIGPLTELVLDRALSDCARWLADGHQIGVAINVSTRSLHNRGFPEVLAAAAARAGISPSSITLEVTEAGLVGDSSRAMDVLRDLRMLGTRLSIDDFGTGLSSLSVLRQLPVDELKIDRRFTSTVLDGGDEETIIRTIIAMAGEFGLSTVAEGAETEAITSRLQSLGCDVVQGYHVARPMSSDDLSVWLDGQPRFFVS